MSATLPRPFTALAWSNLAAQSAEQLSLAGFALQAWVIMASALNGLRALPEPAH